MFINHTIHLYTFTSIIHKHINTHALQQHRQWALINFFSFQLFSLHTIRSVYSICYLQCCSTTHPILTFRLTLIWKNMFLILNYSSSFFYRHCCCCLSRTQVSTNTSLLFWLRCRTTKWHIFVFWLVVGLNIILLYVLICIEHDFCSCSSRMVGVVPDVLSFGLVAWVYIYTYVYTCVIEVMVQHGADVTGTQYNCM